MNNCISIEEIQEAMQPFVIPYLPEDRFWNHTLLFFEDNNITEYKSTVMDKTGIKILNYRIPEQDAIDQGTLYSKPQELLYDNIYLENKIVLTPSILTLADGSITVEIALDQDANEDLCSDIIMNFFEENGIDEYEPKTDIYSNDIKIYVLLIPKQFGVDQQTLFENTWDYLYNNDYLDRIKIATPSITKFFNGTTKICIIINPDAAADNDY